MTQRAMTTIFHGTLCNLLEDYVDIVVKSKEFCYHVNDLNKVFVRCRRYKLRINS